MSQTKEPYIENDLVDTGAIADDIHKLQEAVRTLNEGLSIQQEMITSLKDYVLKQDERQSKMIDFIMKLLGSNG